MKNSSDEIVAGPGPAGMAGPPGWGHRGERMDREGHGGPGVVAPARPTLWRRPRARRRIPRRGDAAARAADPGAAPPAPVAADRPAIPARHTPRPARHAPGPARHTPLVARGGPPAGAARLLPGRGGRRHLAAGGLSGRLAALDPRRRRLRVGLLVGRPPAHPSRQPLGHRLPRGPGRHPARLPHPDAPAGCADDPGHAHLRAERVRTTCCPSPAPACCATRCTGRPGCGCPPASGRSPPGRSSACRPTSPGAAGTS